MSETDMYHRFLGVMYMYFTECLPDNISCVKMSIKAVKQQTGILGFKLFFSACWEKVSMYD